MNLHISIDESSQAGELAVLGDFCKALAAQRTTPHVFTPTTITADAVAAPAAETAAPAAADKPVRTRRARNSDPEEAAPPAAQPPAEEAAQPPAEEAAQPPAEVAATGGRNYTEADVQALASVVARAHGPDKVKEKIAELGGARIAELDADKLNLLGAFLETLK